MTISPSPRISVLMAVHNAEAYVAESVHSVLAQSSADFEFIIIDDGSTDASRAVVEAFDDERIRVLVNDSNQGLAGSLNRGLAEARGQYIARQDADDVSLPTRFERQRAFLDTAADVGVVGTGVICVDHAGEPAGTYAVHPSHGEILWEVAFGHAFAHPTVMMRTELLRSVGGYDATCRASEDQELWTRLAPLTRFANLTEPLLRYRIHDAMASRTRATDQRQEDIRARQTFVQDLIHRTVSPDVLRWYALPPSARQLRAQPAEVILAQFREFARVLGETRRAIRDRFALSGAELAGLDRLAGRKLYGVASAASKLSPMQGAALWARAAVLDPSLASPTRMAGALSRVVSRTKDGGS